MHISEGILSGSVLIAGWAGSIAGISYGLKKTAGLMDEVYTYISMIEDSPENADIIAGSLRTKSQEAGVALNDVAGKISALGIQSGANN